MENQKAIAKKYQGLFDLMNREYDLIVTQSEMNDIIAESEKVIKSFGDLPCDNCTKEYIRGIEDGRTIAKNGTVNWIT